MLASIANQRASSSSASFTNSWKHHVFLSFRGLDTRSNFTGHLYSALCQHGINTFMDDDELRRGEEISRTLLTAIEDSKISVVVFSKNYASSKWCLDELVKILDCKESNQQRVIIPVFYKVTPSDVRNHRGSFGDALANMECKYKDNMEKVNRWREALSQAANLSGFTLLDEHQSESKFIQNIIEEISKHVLNRVCLEVAEHPVGMQAQVQVMNKLLDLREEEDVRMVGVWGTGGIGKTTVAKAVYNSIAHEFEGCSFLANVRERSMSHEGSVGLQENLLSDILRVNNLKVTNVDKGAVVIRERLSCRKVLLVLDDVNDMDQLQNLAGACEWFGAGSRIIITTRDKQLLTAHDVNLIHEVKILDDDKALELFSWYAFKRSGPPFGDYVKLAERAIRYAQGLPLALKVLGSCLYGGSIDKWEAALDGFKSKKIQDVLKISYNALHRSVQEVFLDIACFFKGKSRNYVTEACELKTRYGIDVLIQKALISVEHGVYIQMHDLLEKMGKDIIEQESRIELGERSRLWFHEDVEHVLTNNTGTNKITGIVLNFPKQDDEIFLNVGRSFSKMKNLKILINYNVYLFGDPSSIPNNLRVLEWHGCPFQYFPGNFLQKALFVLNPFRMRIKQLGEGLKHLTKLTSLNFEGSKFLIEIPDLSNSPNLRRQERLEFLYDSGLAVGRPGGSDSFKTLEALPKTEEAPSSSAASKQQSSASVPGALFEEKPQSANDAWRKLHSDPLLMIRQREQEVLSRIKNNPVQMAMIRKSVEAKKPAEKLHDKKEHQKKKHHTGASKHSKHSSSIQASDSENDTAEVERRKSGHRKISKYVQHSDSEDESRKRARRHENTVKHSDSEDESRIRAHRSGKKPVKHSDSEDEFRYRTRRSEKNHVKHSDLENESHNRAHRSGKNPVNHSDSEDESHYRARRSEKNHVKHSDLEDESHNRARRSGKNPVNHSDSEDELRYRAWRSEKNHVKQSGSEDVSRNRAHRSGKNPVKHSDSEDESRYRAQRSEKNHVKHSDSEDESRKRAGRSEKNLVKHSDSEDESRNRACRGEKNQSIKIGRDDGQGDAKGKHDNLELEKYPMKGRNESHYKRRNVAPKLSEEERAARLKEMQIDAELHEEQRWKRLKKAEENDALEATQAVKSSGRNFLDAVQTSVYGAERGGSSTIEESVRRRTHYLQGRSEASERNAFRR